MSTWLLSRQELTPDQLRAVELPATGHKLILGLPGSGKTQVLIHRAAFLREKLKTPPERYRVFIFTNVLRDYIRSGLVMLDLPEGAVCTFDHYCVELYNKHISPFPKYNRRGKTPDFNKIREAVLVLLTKQRDLRNVLDFALVDEGQDLTQESFAILTALSRHVTVCADYLQQIYEQGSDEGAILYQLGLKARNVTLLGAYRNSPEVARLAAWFIPDATRRDEYLAQVRPGQAVRERPLLFIARSFEEEMDRLASIVRERQVMNERVGILVPLKREVYEIAAQLKKRGVEVEMAVPAPPQERASGKTVIAFDNMVPKVVSFHSAKGLTFDSVFLPGLSKEAFGLFEEGIRTRMFFVGIARAMRWVYLSAVQSHETPELARLHEAETRGQLEVQKGGKAKARPQRPEEEEYSVL